MSNNKPASTKLLSTAFGNSSDANGSHFNVLDRPIWGDTKRKLICIDSDTHATNDVMCVPLVDKSADTIVSAYLKEKYCTFGSSWKFVSYIGSEFKNALFAEDAIQVGVKHLYSSPYRPQANGRIEASHMSLKNCIQIFKGSCNISPISMGSLRKYVSRILLLLL